MNSHLQATLLQAVKASSVKRIEVIQELWSGYGEIVRYQVVDSKIDNLQRVIVKHVRLPQQKNHPRGWNTNLSHERKVHSYEVETAWYQIYNTFCDFDCRTPHCLALEHHNDEVLMVMEDLDDSGFAERRTSVTMEDINVCLSWLAHFHSKFMHKTPHHLWASGTYWHLQTRPEELDELQDIPLKQVAHSIDDSLSKSHFQSFVHGDAKLANFCFGQDEQGAVTVAAVDFQYVGGGCGMKDVAYFIGSCLNEEDCEHYESKLLDVYFAELRKAISKEHAELDADALEQEWRALYYLAWADFHRFLKGWSPGHWKINSYSEKVTRRVIKSITNTSLS